MGVSKCKRISWSRHLFSCFLLLIIRFCPAATGLSLSLSRERERVQTLCNQRNNKYICFHDNSGREGESHVFDDATIAVGFAASRRDGYGIRQRQFHR